MGLITKFSLSVKILAASKFDGVAISGYTETVLGTIAENLIVHYCKKCTTVKTNSRFR